MRAAPLILFLLVISVSFASLTIARGSVQYAQSINSRYNGYFLEPMIKYKLNLAVVAQDNNIVYMPGGYAVCPNSPLTLEARVTDAVWNLRSSDTTYCKLLMIDTTPFDSGQNNLADRPFSITSYSSFTDVMDSYGLLEDAHSFQDTSLKSWLSLTHDNNPVRLCEVVYEDDTNPKSEARDVKVFSALVPNMTLDGLGISIQNQRIDRNLIKTFNFNAPSSTGTYRYSFSTKPGHLLFGAYLPYEGLADYTIDFFPTGVYSTIPPSRSSSLSIVVSERQPSATILSASPDSIISVPQIIELQVKNTGNVPLRVFDVSATNGYEVELTQENQIIDAFSTDTVQVRVTSAGSGDFSITLRMQPTQLTCSGEVFDSVDVPINIGGAPQNLVSGLVPDTTIIDIPPEEDGATQTFYGVVDFEQGFSPGDQAEVLVEVEGETPQTIGPIVVEMPEDTTQARTPPIDIECGNTFSMYKIRVTVDPNNNIQETNEEDNVYERTIVCNAPNACSLNPEEVLVYPGFPASSKVYCGFEEVDGELRPISCDPRGRQDVFVDDEEKQRAEESLDLSFLYRRRMLSLIFSPKDSAPVSEGDIESFDLNILIEDQPREVEGVGKIEVDYTCNVNVSYINAPCFYFI